jgi:hypothetical protein
MHGQEAALALGSHLGGLSVCVCVSLLILCCCCCILCCAGPVMWTLGSFPSTLTPSTHPRPPPRWGLQWQLMTAVVLHACWQQHVSVVGALGHAATVPLPISPSRAPPSITFAHTLCCLCFNPATSLLPCYLLLLCARTHTHTQTHTHTHKLCRSVSHNPFVRACVRAHR